MAWVRVSLWALCALRVALATVFFQEEFLDGERWRNRWVPSNDSRLGHFRLSSGKFYGHKEKDKGLQTTQNSHFYAISARFRPFSNKGQTLVLQYTVKHEQKMDCGGGYVKVFPADLDQRGLNAKSPYYIMFVLTHSELHVLQQLCPGPDICGFDLKKVHVILQFKNEYHANKKFIKCKVDGFTHLYTLILRPDLTYEVKIDGRSIESGSIEYDWQLTSLRKTEQAVASPGSERAKAGAGQDWEKHFLDAGASKPSDWNSELDGDWPGPMLQKPPYQDGLKPEAMDQDLWLHEKMPSTGYLTRYDLSEFESIGAIGLELWQVRSGTIFDNFLLTDDEKYAENFGKATWGQTKGPEKEMDDILIKEEVTRAREEEEDELLEGRFHRPQGPFHGFPRQNEL
ncbi:calreticulin-3 isoform X1 [Fukomys damarensis]|uniref:calreticulin-3 isoform X1 n=1 Tax=Fukomys damarensis TaxID=885580 RepID=UPI00053FA379|nr:calreticulin-3 isoform X1 [Fukomys damarensis]